MKPIKMPEKKIETLNELEEFICAVVIAHGDMISTDEAIEGLTSAFKEYRDHITVTNYEQANQRWTID